MKRFLVLSFVLLNLGIDYSEARLGIFGGANVTIRDAPYLAAYLSNNILECGATILGPKCVMTTGYCGLTYNNNPQIRVGSSRKDNGGTLIDVEKIVVHPNYHPEEVAFDYSLLILKDKLEYNDKVQPIKINCDCKEIPDGTPCNITGWGLTELRRFPRDLRSTNIFVINSDVCRENYHNSDIHYTVDENIICAGVPGGKKDSCYGDHGGPLVCDGKLAGIISTGYGCGYKDFPGLYSRVSKVRRWIKSVCGV